MNINKQDLASDKYNEAMQFEYAGMINALNYLCMEAKQAKLDIVALHLSIAIEELKEYHQTNIKAG